MIKFDESGVKLINNNYLVGFYVFNVLVGINAFLAMIIHSFRGSNKVSLFTSKILIISLIYFLLNTSVFAVEGFKAKNNEEYKNKYYAVITPTPTPVVEVKVTPTVVVKKTVKVNNTQNTNTSIDRNQIECIGPDGKQFKTTMDECKKLNEKWGKPVDYMINCEFPPECGGGTKYMKYSECMKPCTRVSAGTRNNSTSYPPCTIYYPYLKSSSTYYYMSPEECQKQKDRIAAGSTQTIPTSVLPKTTIPTQTVYVAPTTSQAEIEARISKCNSRCRSIRSSAIVDLQREAKALGNASSSWYDSRLNSIYTTYYSCASQCY